MQKLAIHVENIGKLYRLGEVGTGTISHDLNRWLARIRGKEDPYSKIGEKNDRTSISKGQYVWALKDISFDIPQGSAVGIIGNNGAGKSTLLKILSRVTSPTVGTIKTRGRVASLLEVGTEFHPELTGRENIYLNGAILGMTRKEIKNKFDEIVSFAGVDRYIDTPVKRYSSGMYVRLAFAVAAHLNCEILIVDEVLAVGDAEFQKKCLGKMSDVIHHQGRTVLFVSHNMAAVKNLCSDAILLKHGQLVAQGSTTDIIDRYLSDGTETERYIEYPAEARPASDEIEVVSIKLFDAKGRLDSILTTADELRVEVEYTIKQDIKDLRVALTILSLDGLEIISSSDFLNQPENRLRRPGNYKSVCIIPGKLLNLGTYLAAVDFDIPNMKPIIMGLPVRFTISELSFNQLGFTLTNRPAGVVHPYLNWEISEV